MPISQVEGIIYANQNMQVAASKQVDYQSRVDFQNMIATATANEKQLEVEETKATKEGVELNPDREHNQEKADEESGEKKQEINIKKMNMKKVLPTEEFTTTHILDIKV